MSDSEVPPKSLEGKAAAPESLNEEEEVAIVLAAIDTSPLASRVIELAARIARRTWSRAQLHLLHVFAFGRSNRAGRAGPRREELLAEAGLYLDSYVRAARRQCPAPVSGYLAEGDPVEQILKSARALSADLVIVGTHDAAGLERLLMGSVAAKVARLAPCPVLVARSKQRPYKKVSE